MSKRVVMVAAPLVAVATLALGLRVGAKDAVTAATIFGAPPAHVGDKTRLAWQMLTYLDDRGVRETVPMRDLVVTGVANGARARWAGSSNEDGVAEVVLDFDAVTEGSDLELTVERAGDPAPLAKGRVTWSTVTWGHAKDSRASDRAGSVRPTRRDGSIGLDVMVEGQRLVPGFPTSLFVCALPRSAGVAIDIAPEPGLLVDKASAATCDDGCAEVSATAQAHVVGVGFTARAASGTGTWFGALPVAPGAFFIDRPRVVAENVAVTVTLVAPNPRTVVYAELDDEEGRVVAAALPLTIDPKDSIPRARFDLPPLRRGLYWIVASGEPRGAERLLGAAVAKALYVGSANDSNRMHLACDRGPWLAHARADGFPRWIALDGLPMRSAANVRKHRLGLLIGLASLLIAGILEFVLLAAAAREARANLLVAELDADNDAPARMTAKGPGGTLLVATLVVLLGLGLLAVLLVAKA